MAGRSQVGTLREKPLHAALKRWYAGAGDRVEVPVDGYVVDLVRGDELVEIQTSGFSALKLKLDRLLEDHAVRVVHPVAAEKWIVKLDAVGAVVSRRRSPKHGSAIDVFAELVSFPRLVTNPGFTLEVALVHEEEIRRFDGTRGWRRRGWVVEERRLLDVVDRIVVDGPDALAALIPRAVPERFTTADLAAVLGRPRRLAQQMAYCLRESGVVAMVGREGNAIVYERSA